MTTWDDKFWVSCYSGGKMGNITAIIRKDGRVSYKARIRLQGQPCITKTFRIKSKAQHWIEKNEYAAREGNKLNKTLRFTLKQAIDRYIEEVIPNKKMSTQAVDLPRLEFWNNYIGHLKLSEIDKDILSTARQYLRNTPAKRKYDKLPKLRGPATVNRYFAILRHVFAVAENEWEWVNNNPVSKLRQLREPVGRQRSLSDEELELIVSALVDHPRKDFRLIVLIALTTGCRRGNAQALKWENIDFKIKTLTFPDTKNNCPLVVPLSLELFEELKKYRVETGTIGGYLFPSRPGSKHPFVDVKQIWRRFVKTNSLKDLRFHDLRHAVGSFLAKQNVPLFTIGKLLGHKSLESTRRYAHLGVADVIPMVESLGERLRRVRGE